jgi:hypothetical protein
MTDNEEKLLAGLKALAASDAASETSGPPPELEAALLKQLKRKRTVISWPLALEVLAAAAIILIAVFARHAPAVSAEFIAVPYAAPIGEYERTEVVRVNVPVTALAQWGLPVSSMGLSQRVDADVVIGEDGLARAVRFVENP